MSSHTFKPPYNPRDVRPDYHKGVWRYAIGRAASEHPKYAESVDICGKRWNPWWIRTWQDVEAVLAGCWFDEAEGRKRADWFPKWLRLSKGKWSGKPFELIDWQIYDLIMPLFGWKRTDGTRRFRRAYIEIPKKNGKSALCSGIGLMLLCADGESGAEVYSAAGDRHQAGIIHDESSRMVRQSESLTKHLECIDYKKAIVYPAKFGRFEALSADAALSEGLNWHGLLFDELHVQRNRVFWDTLVYGGISRDQPLALAITTAGVYDQLSIGWEEHDYAIKVHSGTVTDWSHYVFIAAAGPDDDWTKPATWKRANPSYGVTIKEDDFAEQCAAAVEKPAKQNSFKRYRLNIWTSQTARLVTAEAWDKCALNSPDFDADLAGKACYGGLDLSMSRDITAFTLWFPRTEQQQQHRILTWFWLPGENIRDLERESRAPYTQWAQDGHMELTGPGPIVDYARVRQVINDLMSKYNIVRIGFDPWGATDTSIALRAEHGEDFLVEVRQGMYTMAPATKYVLELIDKQEIAHNGNPVMSWHVSNAQGYYDKAGNCMVQKGDGKVRFKVDGFVSCIIAASVVMREEQPKDSVYESRGILTLGDLMNEMS